METNSENMSTTSSIQSFHNATRADKLFDAMKLSQVECADTLKTYYLLAKVFYDKADFKQAENYFLKALQNVKRPEDDFFMIKILGFLIRIASEDVDEKRIQSYLFEAEKILAELSTTLVIKNAEFYYNLGLVNNYRGNFEVAKEKFLHACSKGKEENDPGLLAKCFLSLAMNSFSLKDYNQSLKYLDQLRDLLKIIKKDYLNGSMNFFLGKINCKLGNFEEALENLNKAAKSFQEKKCWNLHGYIFLWRGIIHKEKGELEKAGIYYNSGMELMDRYSHKRLYGLLKQESDEINDSSVDIYLDSVNRVVIEKTLGVIDFKHRFVLLEILFLLAKNVGSNFSKDDLVAAVWKDEYNPLIHDKLIYTSVSRLRKLIEPKNIRGTKRKYIIRGKDGYTFSPWVKVRFKVEKDSSEYDNKDKLIPNIELLLPV